MKNLVILAAVGVAESGCGQIAGGSVVPSSMAHQCVAIGAAAMVEPVMGQPFNVFIEGLKTLGLTPTGWEDLGNDTYILHTEHKDELTKSVEKDDYELSYHPGNRGLKSCGAGMLRVDRASTNGVENGLDMSVEGTTMFVMRGMKALNIDPNDIDEKTGETTTDHNGNSDTAEISNDVTPTPTPTPTDPINDDPAVKASWDASTVTPQMLVGTWVSEYDGLNDCQSAKAVTYAADSSFTSGDRHGHYSISDDFLTEDGDDDTGTVRYNYVRNDDDIILARRENGPVYRLLRCPTKPPLGA